VPAFHHRRDAEAAVDHIVILVGEPQAVPSSSLILRGRFARNAGIRNHVLYIYIGLAAEPEVRTGEGHLSTFRRGW